MVPTVFQRVKFLIRSASWNINALLLKKRERKGETVILVYHGLVPHQHTKYNMRFITVGAFVEQLKLFKKKVNMVSVEDVFEQRTDKQALNLAITFDDGFRNNHSFAAPELDKFQVPASFYISAIQKKGFAYLWADYLDVITPFAKKRIEIDGRQFTRYKNEFRSGGKTLKSWCKDSGLQFKLQMIEALQPFAEVLHRNDNHLYWQLLTTQQMQELSDNPLFTIGSHGIYHNNLTSISREDAITELVESKSFLEEVTGREVNQFAFPDGSYTPELLNVAEDCGYRYLLLVSRKYDQPDKRVQERFVINPFLFPYNQLYYIRKGRY
jgi:peptidoglycan/xylan/chitin deacetylase (PgdA/CDA1 family)